MTFNTAQARHAMIEQQIRPWDISDMSVLQVFEKIAREDFVAVEHKKLAFSDLALPIAHQQVMMKPVIEARMLQALKLQASDDVLEIGTGSGFITACLAQLTRAVTSLDIHPDFIDSAKSKVLKSGLSNVQFECVDALNYVTSHTFDAIVVTGAVAEIPAHFRQWLRPNGRLFVICGYSPVQEALCITCTGDTFTYESLFETDVPYLLGAQPKATFTL